MDTPVPIGRTLAPEWARAYTCGAPTGALAVAFETRAQSVGDP
ncbi:hypothetical protein [Halosimplex litoreum]|nr:hypothetical protein [Halosimplex litoreum]